MGRIKILLWLLLFPLAANASWTYVGTSGVSNTGTATYNVTAGQAIIVIIADDNTITSSVTQLTDSKGNLVTSYVSPADHSSISGFSWGGWLGCTSPYPINYGINNQIFYGVATSSGVGATLTYTWSGTGTMHYIEVLTFNTTATAMGADWANGQVNWAGAYYGPAPLSSTPAHSDELYITTAIQFNKDQSTTAITPTSAPTGLTAVGGGSWNFYSVISASNSFSFPNNDTNTCGTPGSNNFDNYVPLFQTLGFYAYIPPATTKQPSVNVYIGQ